MQCTTNTVRLLVFELKFTRITRVTGVFFPAHNSEKVHRVSVQKLLNIAFMELFCLQNCSWPKQRIQMENHNAAFTNIYVLTITIQRKRPRTKCSYPSKVRLHQVLEVRAAELE